MTRAGTGLQIPVPGRATVRVRHAVFDFNGTLALDGALLPGLASRLRKLASLLPVTVLTADTFGTAAAALRGLPVTLHTVRTGRDKAAFVTRWQSSGAVAIGNGNNDTAMFRMATLSIAVLGHEGLSPATLRAATVVVASPADAIDLLLRPSRLTATLRA